MKLFSGLGNLAYHADLDLYQMISCWMVKLSCRHGTASIPRSVMVRSR